MLFAVSDAALVAGTVVGGVGTAIGGAIVLYLNTRAKPSPPTPPPYSDEQVQAIRTREPALLAFIVELREQIVECTKRAEEAAAAAQTALASARAEAERHSAEAKKWQDEVLRLQGLVERLLPDG